MKKVCSFDCYCDDCVGMFMKNKPKQSRERYGIEPAQKKYYNKKRQEKFSRVAQLNP